MSLCNFKIYIFGYSFVKLYPNYLLLKKGSQNCHQVYYSEAGYMILIIQFDCWSILRDCKYWVLHETAITLDLLNELFYILNTNMEMCYICQFMTAWHFGVNFTCAISDSCFTIDRTWHMWLLLWFTWQVLHCMRVQMKWKMKASR